MGSPLGSVLANLFMGYHEKIWLEEFKTCKVVLYRWYVDNIICLFAFINSGHLNIKFTFEKKKGNKIAFLDICINKTNPSFCTSLFQKRTSISLYTNFSSFIPFSYKIGLIKTLIHQTYAISSSWNLFMVKLKNTKHLLEKTCTLPIWLIPNKVIFE